MESSSLTEDNSFNPLIELFSAFVPPFSRGGMGRGIASVAEMSACCACTACGGACSACACGG